MSTFFQTLDKKTTLNNSTKQKASHLIFRRFHPFNCCLSVVLSLDEGYYPENLQIVCVCVIIDTQSANFANVNVIIDKNSFESFMCLVRRPDNHDRKG